MTSSYHLAQKTVSIPEDKLYKNVCKDKVGCGNVGLPGKVGLLWFFLDRSSLIPCQDIV